MKRAWRKRMILGLAWSAMTASLCAQEAAKPLPDLPAFLKEIRKNLRSDRLLVIQYTYTEKSVQRQLDKKGAIKKTEEEIFEVYPSVEPRNSYRRLIAKDGKPVDPKELSKSDREQETKAREQLHKLQNESPREKEKRLEREKKDRAEEDRLIDELFRMYDIQMLGRETIEGHSAILLSFHARPDARPVSREAKMLMKMAGRAWFSESEYQMIRVEVELEDTVSIGWGMLARLNKGARAVIQRRKVNGEVWLPAEARFTGSARILLLKGMNVDTRTEYSDYRKFSVQTSVTFDPPRP